MNSNFMAEMIVIANINYTVNEAIGEFFLHLIPLKIFRCVISRIGTLLSNNGLINIKHIQNYWV
jgi:hypothetical protein